MKNIILSTTTLAGFIACGAPEVAYPTISIGAVLDRTGSVSGYTWSDSVLLAATQVNQALTNVNGQVRFQLLSSDLYLDI